MRTCPICGGPVGARETNPDLPFCSERCRMIDLGKWLGGDYRVAGPPAGADDIAEALRDAPTDADDDGGPTLH